MSAADRVVVRTPHGYVSMPRRAALGMISTGRAKRVKAPEEPAPAKVSQDIRDQLSGALGVPPEVLTPADDGADHWTVGQPFALSEPSFTLSEPRGNASRAMWAHYAESLGVVVTDDMSRNEVRDVARAAAQSVDRLPQPAHEGGRLDTPEDEPVAEGSVTDDEDPGTE